MTGGGAGGEVRALKWFRGRQKKLGAALGSGGAKGMAHLGVIQALAERGVAFDAVAGTSAGALVGALYARGYTPRDIGELLARLDYKNMALSVLLSKSLDPVRALLDDVLGQSEFPDLRLPFAAVATDAENGEEAVLSAGNVARAVLASCAMPPYFRPVAADGRRLVDGAFVNAVPGDVARALGADFVIGVALSPAERYRETMFAAADGTLVRAEQAGFAACDILLEPDLSAYSATSVLSGAQMFDIGYACAEARADEIVRALRERRIPLRS